MLAAWTPSETESDPPAVLPAKPTVCPAAKLILAKSIASAAVMPATVPEKPVGSSSFSVPEPDAKEICAALGDASSRVCPAGMIEGSLIVKALDQAPQTVPSLALIQSVSVSDPT